MGLSKYQSSLAPKGEVARIKVALSKGNQDPCQDLCRPAWVGRSIVSSRPSLGFQLLKSEARVLLNRAFPTCWHKSMGEHSHLCIVKTEWCKISFWFTHGHGDAKILRHHLHLEPKGSLHDMYMNQRCATEDDPRKYQCSQELLHLITLV